LVENTNASQYLISITVEENSYADAIIEEAPLFPGCKRGDEIAARQCFQ